MCGETAAVSAPEPFSPIWQKRPKVGRHRESTIAGGPSATRGALWGLRHMDSRLFLGLTALASAQVRVDRRAIPAQAPEKVRCCFYHFHCHCQL